MIPLILFLYARRRRAQNKLRAEVAGDPTVYSESGVAEDQSSLLGTSVVDTMVNERTPLLDDHTRNFWAFPGFGGNEEAGNSKLPGPNAKDDGKRDPNADLYHLQFCQLVGIPPSDASHETHSTGPIPPKSLYGRAVRYRNGQGRTYAFTAALSNTLLLSQVVLGAALTALGASESSHVLITLFGAANTIIAGVVAYLKSRGQPMRARMFRDDLDRVVDEIENSEIMWRGEFL
jgi:SMODS and SLOG-associating 2TM effector domain